jgi:ankyrin repeat protein
MINMLFLRLFTCAALLVSSAVFQAVDKPDKVPLTKEEQWKILDHPLHQATAEGNIAQAQELLEKGANVNSKDPVTNETPLHIATEVNNLALIKLLLAKGANVNGVDNYHATSLFKAFEKQAGKEPRVDVIVLLLEAGADPNIPTKQQETALDGMLQSPNSLNRSLFRKLILYGAKRNVRQNADDHLQIAMTALSGELLQALALRNIIASQDRAIQQKLARSKQIEHDQEGVSALAYAAGQGVERVFNLFIEHPFYQHDIKGMIAALNIVNARLRGLKPESAEYKEYGAILKRLCQALLNAISPRDTKTIMVALEALETPLKSLPKETQEHKEYENLYKRLQQMLIDRLISGAHEAITTDTDLPWEKVQLPPEIWNHIFGLLPASSLPTLFLLSTHFSKR